MDSKRTIIALNCAIFLYMFGVGLITPLLPGKILAFLGSVVQVGWLASAFACAYILSQVPIGIWADKLGYSLFITLGFLACGVAGSLFVTADSTLFIIAGRFVQGIGEAPLWALAPALFSILNPKHKARIIGWYTACLHIGLTSGSVFFLVSNGSLSSRLAFMIFVILCITAGIISMVFANTKTCHCKEIVKILDADTCSISTLLRHPKVVCILPGIVVYGVGYGIYLTIIPTFLLKNSHIGQDSIGWLFIGFYVGISLAQFAGGYLADVKGRFLPMAAGLSIFSLGQLLFPYFSIAIGICFLSIASFGLGLFFIGAMAALNDYAGNNAKGLISGIFYLFWGTGYFVGPLMLGYAGEHDRYVLGFTCLGIMSLSICIWILIANCYLPARITR